MKEIIKITIILFSIVVFGQQEPHKELFKTDSTWIKEIIDFPISFAPDINYEGFEDLRFPQGWSKENSPNFWSYVWAWEIVDKGPITEEALEKNIQRYFDGLLGLEFYNIDGKYVRNSNAVFVKTKDAQYVGKVKTFDTRYTKAPMTLNVLATSYICTEEKKRIILFRFSPKPYNHEVWNTLKTVKLISRACSK